MTDIQFFDKIKKRDLHGLYLLVGAEEYSKEKAIVQCKAIVSDATRDFNIATLDAPSARDVFECAQMLPFFDTVRVITVNNISTEEMNALSEHMELIPDSSIVLLRKGEIKESKDKDNSENKEKENKNKSPSAYQKLKKMDRVVEFHLYDATRARMFVDRCAKKFELKLSAPVKSFLINFVGTDLATLENSLLMLDAFVRHGNEITRESVTKCITPSPEYKTYRIFDDFLNGNLRSGISAIQTELSERRQSVPSLVGYFHSRLRTMMIAKQMMLRGSPEKDLIELLNPKYPSLARKQIATLKKIRLEKLERIMQNFINIDILIRRNGYPDTSALLDAIYNSFSEEVQSDKTHRIVSVQ